MCGVLVFWLSRCLPPLSPSFPYPPLFRSAVPAVPQERDQRQGHQPRMAFRSSCRRRFGELPALFHGREERSEEHTSELQSRFDLVCRLLLEKNNTIMHSEPHTTPLSLPVP